MNDWITIYVSYYMVATFSDDEIYNIWHSKHILNRQVLYTRRNANTNEKSRSDNWRLRKYLGDIFQL